MRERKKERCGCLVEPKWAGFETHMKMGFVMKLVSSDVRKIDLHLSHFERQSDDCEGVS